MTRTDREALRRAMATARRESAGHDQQLTAKLRQGDAWEQVAAFASFLCQRQALHLRSYQPTPCWMGDEKPIDDIPIAGRVICRRRGDSERPITAPS